MSPKITLFLSRTFATLKLFLKPHPLFNSTNLKVRCSRFQSNQKVFPSTSLILQIDKLKMLI